MKCVIPSEKPCNEIVSPQKHARPTRRCFGLFRFGSFLLGLLGLVGCLVVCLFVCVCVFA